MSYTRVGGGSNQVTTIETYRYTPSAGATSVSGADANGRTLAYDVGYEMVFLNGVRLVRGDDYVATTGTSITGLAALASGDVVEVISFGTLEVANALTQAYGDGTYLSNSLVQNTGLQFADGSATAPSVSNVGDTNTGLYFPAADTIAVTTAGAERLRVASGGSVLIGTTSVTANGGVLEIANGLTFPATQSACANGNTLDDYEEGTFTPTILGTSTNPTLTTSTNVGVYTKVGRLVHIRIEIVVSSLSNAGGGALLLGGLPFTPAAFTTCSGILHANFDTPAGLNVVGAFRASTDIYFGMNVDNAGVTDIQTSALKSNTGLYISGTYYV